MSSRARIPAATPPYPEGVQEAMDRLMPPGVEPLVLFRTLARDGRLFARLMGAGLLDKGHLTLREREIAIARTCARCGSEYEWGVHAAFFAERVGFSEEQLRATVHGGPEDGAWTKREALIVRLMDELHETSTVSDVLFEALRRELTDMQLVELVMLAGAYHTVSYLTNGLQLPLEPFARRFPDAPPS